MTPTALCAVATFLPSKVRDMAEGVIKTYHLPLHIDNAPEPELKSSQNDFVVLNPYVAFYTTF